MHLLAAQKGTINEGNEAIDLAQRPGDVVVLSAADTELASLAAARRDLGADAPDLRLASLMQLVHPMSVDLYAEKTVAGSKLVVVRVLGGESYWPYGLEMIYALAREKEISLAVLPGDDKPDPGLDRFCTIEAEDCRRLHAYLAEGGPGNARNFLLYCRHLLGEGEASAEAAPLLKSGLWYPGLGICSLEAVERVWLADAPIIAVCFYRALVQSGGLEPVEALVKALRQRGLNALPVFVSSLKDAVSVETVRGFFSEHPPAVAINLTGFAVSSPAGGYKGTVLDETGAVVLQAVLAGGSLEVWENSSQGLSSRDLAMNVALPEVDGRVLSRTIAFKHAGTYDEAVQANIVTHKAAPDRVAFVADLVANWARLRATQVGERRIGLVLANYPNRDGRLGNGVGLDTPAGTVRVLEAMREAGYQTGEFPPNSDALMRHLMAGPTNAARDGREIRETLSLNHYRAFLESLPNVIQSAIAERWGAPEADPFFDAGTDSFALPVARFGHVAVGIQPARGYNIDPKESYHSPDLVPPHGYLAFHAWLRFSFGAHAVVHMGKHGNLEWLPGKALALSAACYPEAALGPVPNLYPFIVNDPGEGSQAKRRTSAVIVDHLTPPLTRAESYGPLRDLEALVDEYYEASGHDPRRLKLLSKRILDLVTDIGLDHDAGIAPDDGEDEKLNKLDAYLCELKEMQIRDGLHVFGRSPEGRLRTDLAVALVRVPGNDGMSLHRAIARDMALAFDPLDCDMAAAWTGPGPDALAEVSGDPWRMAGDTVERIELLAAKLVTGEAECRREWEETRNVLDNVNNHVLPALDACGQAEIGALLAGLDGRFVRPGPSGAPTRGRCDVLPTGRNFYSVDSRAVPTPTAWELGKKSAELLITRYRQDHGEWPSSFGLSVWGTSNMRTGGDDIAQALALIGVKPVWEHASRRVTGYEIVTLAELGRPRVDVTLRISGFFRDAFPAQIELFDTAVRAVGALEEGARETPVAARMREEKSVFVAKGVDEDEAARRAGYRIFG
ncbi:MAG: cobaltochelatase subunit CobN, partial [Salaquimonas sp.]|nr:cobaltochelatase subunit CobN [Salaquimonas sp.]